MPEKVLSPDGSMMWTGTDWIPAPPENQGHSIQDSVVMGDIKTEVRHEHSHSHSTTVHNTVVHDMEKMVRSHLNTMVDAMAEGRLTDSKNIFERAKQIDYDLAISLHDGEYHPRIVNALCSDAENYCYSMVLNYNFVKRRETLVIYNQKFGNFYRTGIDKIRYVLQWDSDHVRTLLLLAEMMMKHNKFGILPSPSLLKKFKDAEGVYQHVLRIEPMNQFALQGIERIEKARNIMRISTIVIGGFVFVLLILAIA
jgi:hypothetical protein